MPPPPAPTSPAPRTPVGSPSGVDGDGARKVAFDMNCEYISAGSLASTQPLSSPRVSLTGPQQQQHPSHFCPAAPAPSSPLPAAPAQAVAGFGRGAPVSDGVGGRHHHPTSHYAPSPTGYATASPLHVRPSPSPAGAAGGAGTPQPPAAAAAAATRQQRRHTSPAGIPAVTYAYGPPLQPLHQSPPPTRRQSPGTTPLELPMEAATNPLLGEELRRTNSAASTTDAGDASLGALSNDASDDASGSGSGSVAAEDATCRAKVRAVVYSLPFQAALFALMIGDLVALGLSYWAEADDSREHMVQPLHIITFVDACIFLIEVLVRGWAWGWGVFLKGRGSWFHRAELVIMVGCVVLEFVTLLDGLGSAVRAISPALITVFRIFRFARLCMVAGGIVIGSASAARGSVSGARRRHKIDGYDLDLAYVTPQIIAMSWPGTGREEFYRNPMATVASFLKEKHPGGFKVYNLCKERSYDTAKFEGRVERVLIDDHNAADLSVLLGFCKSADKWLRADPSHVIVVHCKAGKGRTGTCICSYLLWSGAAPTADEALAKFAGARVDQGLTKFGGVESPSQERYVRYIEAYTTSLGRQLPSSRWRLTRLEMTGMLPPMLRDLTQQWCAALDGSSERVLWGSCGEAPLKVSDDDPGKKKKKGNKKGKKNGPAAPGVAERYKVWVGGAPGEGTAYSPSEYRAYFEEANTVPTGAVTVEYDVSACPVLKGNALVFVFLVLIFCCCSVFFALCVSFSLKEESLNIPLTQRSAGDVRFHWFVGNPDNGIPAMKHSTLWIWINVSMLQLEKQQSITIEFDRTKVDGAHKKKHAKKYSHDFKITAAFEAADAARTTPPQQPVKHHHPHHHHHHHPPPHPRSQHPHAQPHAARPHHVAAPAHTPPPYRTPHGMQV